MSHEWLSWTRSRGVVRVSVVAVMILMLAASLLTHDSAPVSAGNITVDELVQAKPPPSGGGPGDRDRDRLGALPKRGIDYNSYDSRVYREPGSGPRQHAGAPARQSVYTLGSTVTGPAGGSPEEIARGFLGNRPGVQGRPAGDGRGLALEHQFQIGDSGLTHLVFLETFWGIPVFGGQALAHVLGDGSILKADLPGAIAAPSWLPTPTVSPDAAVRAAVHRAGARQSGLLPDRLGHRAGVAAYSARSHAGQDVPDRRRRRLCQGALLAQPGHRRGA